MRLLVVTAKWPLSADHEFLHDEIIDLAGAFERVTVAPLRADGPLTAALPANVTVDASLSQLSFSPAGRTWGRTLTIVTDAMRPNPVGRGFTGPQVRRDASHAAWVRAGLLARADARIVARWAIRRPSPDLGYTFWLGPSTAGLRSAWPDTPLVSRVHGGDLFPSHYGWSSLPFQSEALAAADGVAAVSQRGHDDLLRRYPAMSAKLAVRRLGIADAGQADIADSGGPIKLLSVSSIDGNKRVGMIADVASELARHSGAVEWVHYGTGPLLADVHHQLSDRPPNLVVDLRGQQPVSVIRDDMCRGGRRVFVNLSRGEGAPVSLMEAQSAGLPVVATAVGGTPEVVPTEWNELVPAESSVAEVVAAVRRAWLRPAVEAVPRRAHWQHHYSAARNYPQWAAELRQAAVARPRGVPWTS